MAQAPKVKIGGTDVSGVLNVSYSVSNGTNVNGEFTKQRNCHGIQITRKVEDGDASMASWAQSADESNWQAGSIEFMNKDHQVMKTLNWEQGFLQNYDIDYSPKHKRVLETVNISACVIDVEGIKIDYEWPDE